MLKHLVGLVEMGAHTPPRLIRFFFKVSICLQINKSIIKDKVRENQGKSEDMVLHNTASCGYSNCGEFKLKHKNVIKYSFYGSQCY